MIRGTQRQFLENICLEAAKLILDRSPHSSSTDALIVLRWLNLEERRKCHRCIYAYKCINGQLNHSLDIVRKSDIHSYIPTIRAITILSSSPKLNIIGENNVRGTTVSKTLMN